MSDIELTTEVLTEMRTTDARAEIAKGYRMYKAFEKAGDVVAVLDRVESAILEKNRIHETLTSEIENLSLQKESAQKFIDETKREATKNSLSVMNEAENNANKIIIEAKKQAYIILSDAKAESSLHIEKADNAKAETAKADADLLSKKKELSDVTDMIARHKEAMKKFVG